MLIMDLRRLEVFCKVVENRSFSRAAEEVYLSQPTVSEHIRLLELFLGEKLVDRLGKTVLPTQAGEILYKYAKEILALKEEAISAVKSYKGEVSGKLKVGCSTIPGTFIIPYFIGSFINKYPGARVNLFTGDSRDIVNKVASGKLELGVVGAIFRNNKVTFEEILNDELVLVVYPGHKLLRKKRVTISDLKKYPYVNREYGSGTREFVEKYLRENGLELSDLNIVLEVGSTEAVCHAIKAKVGVSIVSRRAVEDDVGCGCLEIVPFHNLRMLRHFYLVENEGRSKSTVYEAFVNELREWSSSEEEHVYKV